MKNTVKITRKEKESIIIESAIINTTETLIKVKEMLENAGESIYLNINHKQLNTFLDLTNMPAYLLLYFNENQQFEGASYSTNETNSPYIIITQQKKILLLPLKETIEIKDIFGIIF